MKNTQEYIQDMKIEQPEQYAQLTKGYASEEAMSKELAAMAQKAINYHNQEVQSASK